MQRPLTGAILGLLIGIATSVYLARQGIWPADQLTLFFLPGILGLLGILLLSMGRKERNQVTLIIALLILVPMLVWGALGFGSFNETGELNGGCTVSATSSSDSTVVTDTSRGDPFTIDPEGSLSWDAASPTVFENYEWRIWVEVGGIPITVDSDTEANSAGDQDNDGDIANIGEYADSLGVDLDLYRGVYKVGGEAATCDGFGFVEILGDGSDPVALIALVIAISLLIILLVLTFAGRGGAEAETTNAEVDTEGTPPSEDTDPGIASAIAAGAMAADYDDPENVDKLSAEDVEEIQAAQDDPEDSEPAE